MKRCVFTIGFIALTCNSVWATDRIEVPSSFNPVGSGARALGLGGSFIAMADDATAASWNPAALLKLRKVELAVVYSNVYRIEDDHFKESPSANGKQSINEFDLNYLAFSYPCDAEDCGMNMTFSLNYQRLYEMHREKEWFFDNLQSNSLDLERTVDYRQQGALYALGAAYALQVTSDLFVGFTLNFWRDLIKNNHWSQQYEYDEYGFQDGYETFASEHFQTDYQFKGFNYNLGILWEPFEKDGQKWTVGIVYKSQLNADLHKRQYIDFNLTFTEFPQANTHYNSGWIDEPQTMTMPKSFGIGTAYQWTRNFTTSIDVYRTWWSDFAFTNTNGAKLSPIDGSLIEDSNIQNTTQIRLGVEYRNLSQRDAPDFITSLRGGLFIDPIAAGQGKENTYGISIGGGIAYRHWVFDIAYQYRFANNIERSNITNLGYSLDMVEHSVLGSVFYRF